MKVAFYFYLVAALMVTSWAADDCTTKPSFVESTIGTDNNFNDANLLNGNSNIIKIKRIKVYSGVYFFNTVVTNLCTTYVKKTGTPVEEELCNGNGGDLVATVEIPDGVYLKAVLLSVGAYVDWLQFILTNGDVFGPFGGKTNDPSTHSLQATDAVVHSFFGKSGAVLDRLSVTLERNRIFNARLDTPEFTESRPVKVIEDIQFTDPKASLTVDNRDGTGTQSNSYVFEETITTSESYTVTKSAEVSFEVSLSTSVGIEVKAILAGTERTFTAGASFSTENSETKEQTFEEKFSRTLSVEAGPGLIVTGTLYYRRVEYEYEWTGPTICSYTYNPTKEIRDENASFSGTLAGKQPFPESYIKYTEERLTSVPSPSSAPTPAPALSPVTSSPTIVPTNPQAPALSPVTQAPVLPTPLRPTILQPITGEITPPSSTCKLGALCSLCFSGNAIVNVEGKGNTKVSNLQIGDSVLTVDSKFSKVYSFSHKQESAKATYLLILTELMSQSHPLEITKNHLIYIFPKKQTKTKILVLAEEVKAGDYLVSETGLPSKVVSISTSELNHGLYTPMTETGSISVNGVLASTYTYVAVLDSKIIPNRLVHWMSHGAMVPYRFYCSIKKIGCKEESYDDINGLNPWVSFLVKVQNIFLDELTGRITKVLIVLVFLVPGLAAAFAGLLLSFFSFTTFATLLSFLLRAATAALSYYYLMHPWRKQAMTKKSN